MNDRGDCRIAPATPGLLKSNNEKNSFRNPAHINPSIPSNVYRTKILCTLLEELS